MYRYETHCHTAPVSNCADASVKETVCFYKKLGYDGLFITNHFLDGNINPQARQLPYPEQIDYYFRDIEEAVHVGKNIGIRVFPGVELSCKGTDFLIYGLEKDWYKEHPEILEMKKTEELPLMMEAGALVIQAHPYREEHYIDHIRLFPRSVHGVEVVNSCQPEEVNRVADAYADHYNLKKIYGSDNHWGGRVFSKLRSKSLRPALAGMCSDRPVRSVQDFIGMVMEDKMRPFFIEETGWYSLS